MLDLAQAQNASRALTNKLGILDTNGAPVLVDISLTKDEISQIIKNAKKQTYLTFTQC
jgi:hypothetical protein